MIGVTLFRTKFKVRILYKSGNVQDVWMVKFKHTCESDRITSLEYETVSQKTCPLFLGLDNIEAAWQVNARINLFRAIGQILRIRRNYEH
jgi:hypothetical protein